MGVSNFECKWEERVWLGVEEKHQVCDMKIEGLILVLFRNFLSHVVT